MKPKKSNIPFFKESMKNVYMALSFMGLFDIHKLKGRDPKMYKEIMHGRKGK